MKFNPRPKSNGNGSTFLKFEDGEPVKGICRGEIYEYYGRYENKRMIKVEEGTEKAQFRFRVNFVTVENGAFTAKILDAPGALYDLLASLSEEYDMEETKIKITRTGTGRETEYAAIPIVGKEGLSKEHLKQVQAVPLLDVKHKEIAEISPAFDPDEEIPF